MKWWQPVLGMSIAAVGCTHPTTNKPPAPPMGSGSLLHRVYEFKGKGYQPEFNRDPTKRVEWVEEGRNKFSIHGEDLHGGGSVIESFEEGRVGLANGAVLRVKSLTLTYSLDGGLELVEGS